MAFGNFAQTSQTLPRPEKAADYTQRFAVLQEIGRLKRRKRLRIFVRAFLRSFAALQTIAEFDQELVRIANVDHVAEQVVNLAAIIAIEQIVAAASVHHE